jgi:NADPH2:quinone reductase
MKAIRVHAFNSPMQLEEIADLRASAGQVLIRVRAAGVNPADTYVLTGTYAFKPPLPFTPGFDGAGEVLALGDGVTRFAPGQRVYFSRNVSGSYAEQVLCLESQVHPLPANVSFAQGAAIGVPYATAWRALFQIANAQAAETVLVHGASGGVGLAAVQLARAAGLTVIATGGTDAGRELVRQQGAHHVLDHHADIAPEIARLTGGRGLDVILEMLANKNLGRDLPMLAKLGRVVVIGSRGPVEINPRDTMGRDAKILGMVLFNANERELATIHAALAAALESGVARPVIGEEIPLAEANRAHEAVMGSRHLGKIVLAP